MRQAAAGSVMLTYVLTAVVGMSESDLAVNEKMCSGTQRACHDHSWY